MLDRVTGAIAHRQYFNIIDYIKQGDVIVLNNTKVIKARLLATSTEGTEREFLLLERHAHEVDVHRWKVLYKGKIKQGQQYSINGTTIRIDSVEAGGIAHVSSEDDLLALSERAGHIPLPPYLHRQDTPEDAVRYQTEFAKEAGSVAAPTASLNFTQELIDQIKAKGAQVVYLTLHVGLGTFLPIRVDTIENHKMHSEYFEIPANTIAAIQSAKATGNRIVAVGTTVTRTLEYCAPQILAQVPSNMSGEADIFIYPGYQFKVVDALLTNFHAPKTTVLMLAAAFADWDNLKRAYDEALANGYHFLSYGDSMFISSK